MVAKYSGGVVCVLKVTVNPFMHVKTFPLLPTRKKNELRAYWEMMVMRKKSMSRNVLWVFLARGIH